MNIKLFNKILIVALILLIVSSLIPIKVNAVSDMFQSADDFLAAGSSPTTVIDETKLQSTSGTIYKWLMTIAICVAVIIGAVIGVQFIVGSVEGKAKIQEALVPYIIGCVVVFGSFFIWKTLVNTGNSLEGDTQDSYADPAMEMSMLTVQIGDGKVEVSRLTDEQLKRLWSNNSIDTNIKDKMAPGKTIEQAVGELGDVSQKIYNECKKRDLVMEYETTYWNNSTRQLETGTLVKLKDE